MVLRALAKHCQAAGAVALAGLLTLALAAAAGPAAAKPAWIVVDADSGRTIKAHRPDHRHYPASLTKLMTLYLTFEALRSGELKLDQELYVSPHAASMPPSELGLRPGDRLSVDTAIKALTTKSANDAAVALAEELAGTEWDFAMRMTRRARALGMDSTKFRNASGLPNPYQVTTVRDMARLGRALIDDFPGYYRYFSVERLRYHGRVYRNHNNLLDSYAGADGMKTGYIDASGYNLVASAERGSRRLIAVAVGGRSAAARDSRVAQLLDAGFAELPPSRPPRPPQRPQVRTAQATGAYAVQVGAFSQQAPAQRLANRARQDAASLLESGRTEVVRQHGGARLYRARVVGVAEDEAERACRQLQRRGFDCLVVRRADRQIANR